MSVLCCMELWVIIAFHFVECASHLYCDDIFKFLQGNEFIVLCEEHNEQFSKVLFFTALAEL